MFRHISKLTSSTLKSLFSQYNNDHITPKLVGLWLQDIQIGFDALLDDRIIDAEDIFTAKKQTNCHYISPFHAFGYALLMYTKAMLAMEKVKMDEASEAILHVESILKRVIHSTKKKRKSTMHTSSTLTEKASLPSSCSVPFDISSFDSYPPRSFILDDQADLEHHFELLLANCTLMSATLQFLRDSWIDHMKAAYDLRKAYKMYERMFETIFGVSITEYEVTVIRQPNQPRCRLSARRTLSYNGGMCTEENTEYFHDTIKYGVFFGIGLFNIIFSLLPAKVGKVLNSLGFHSSRTTAIYLLQKSYKSRTMYSSLSAAVLLSFYTNVSIYIKPQINRFFLFKDAKSILTHMKLQYPSGRAWQFIEGKFKRLEGQLDQSIITIKKAKIPILRIDEKAPEMQDAPGDTEKDYFRNSSITEFTQFRSFAIYELGWVHIYSGNYAEASESFFCLESMSNWSRIFYHYVSTCCIIADGMYDKAVLEIRQIVNMLDQKRKMGGRISSNEFYAEQKVRYWLEMSQQDISLKETLCYISNPLWELVYLWNGTSYWKEEVMVQIKQQILHRWKQETYKDPMLCLIMGVIYRDTDKNIELAMEYFNLVLIPQNDSPQKKKTAWVVPYAMYEIAVTQYMLDTNWEIIKGWIHCIESYYLQNPQDKEWETRMQLRCQLLLESCNKA